MRSAPGERHRFRACTNHRARRERRKRPRHHASAESERTVASAFGASQSTARPGPRRWVWQCPPSVRPGPEISERGERVGVAICLSFVPYFYRSANGQEATASHRGRNFTNCIEKGRRCRGDCETRELPQPPPFFRDAFVRARLRLAWAVFRLAFFCRAVAMHLAAD